MAWKYGRGGATESVGVYLADQNRKIVASSESTQWSILTKNCVPQISIMFGAFSWNCKLDFSKSIFLFMSFIMIHEAETVVKLRMQLPA